MTYLDQFLSEIKEKLKKTTSNSEDEGVPTDPQAKKDDELPAMSF